MENTEHNKPQSGNVVFTPPPPEAYLLPEEPKKRPTFLLVVCILTFIGSGLAFFGCLWNLFQGKQGQIEAARELERTLSQMPRGMRDYMGDTIDYMYATADNFWMVQIITFVSVACTILAAVMMLKLNKQGYYLYIIMCFVQVVLPFVVIVNSASVMTATIGGVISGIFILLYGLNLKHMK